MMAKVKESLKWMLALKVPGGGHLMPPLRFFGRRFLTVIGMLMTFPDFRYLYVGNILQKKFWSKITPLGDFLAPKVGMSKNEWPKPFQNHLKKHKNGCNLVKNGQN